MPCGLKFKYKFFWQMITALSFLFPGNLSLLLLHILFQNSIYYNFIREFKSSYSSETNAITITFKCFFFFGSLFYKNSRLCTNPPLFFSLGEIENPFLFLNLTISVCIYIYIYIIKFFNYHILLR